MNCSRDGGFLSENHEKKITLLRSHTLIYIDRFGNSVYSCILVLTLLGECNCDGLYLDCRPWSGWMGPVQLV